MFVYEKIELKIGPRILDFRLAFGFYFCATESATFPTIFCIMKFSLTEQLLHVWGTFLYLRNFSTFEKLFHVWGSFPHLRNLLFGFLLLCESTRLKNYILLSEVDFGQFSSNIANFFYFLRRNWELGYTCIQFLIFLKCLHFLKF